MSMSMDLSWNVSMTFWYAPASASGVAQFGPSLLPLQPPIDGTTSPPADRIAAMVSACAPPVRLLAPSQAGLQPLEASTKAIVKALMPVAFMTVAGAGGLPQPGYRYGADAILVPPGGVVGGWVVGPVVGGVVGPPPQAPLSIQTAHWLELVAGDSFWFHHLAV